MIVDDSVVIRGLIGRWLDALPDMDVVARCRNGQDAVEQAGRVKPDVVVLDIEMPVMDGITLIEQVRCLEAPLSGVPIIAASGNADEEMRRQAVSAGADHFMTKPFDLGVLRKEMASLLKGRRRPGIGRTPNATLPTNRLDAELKRLEQS